MKLVNKIAPVLMAAIVAFGLSLSVNAAPANSSDIGVVDFQKVVQSYAKAKDFAAQDESKKKELKDVRDSLATQLKDAENKSPVEKKALEDKLNEQFSVKLKEYRTWAVTQDEALRKSIDTAVQAVAKEQNVSMILIKPAVVQGGRDLSEEVIKKLNK
jgi:outer membrane protein